MRNRIGQDKNGVYIYKGTGEAGIYLHNVDERDGKFHDYFGGMLKEDTILAPYCLMVWTD